MLEKCVIRNSEGLGLATPCFQPQLLCVVPAGTDGSRTHFPASDKSLFLEVTGLLSSWDRSNMSTETLPCDSGSCWQDLRAGSVWQAPAFGAAGSAAWAEGDAGPQHGAEARKQFK